MISDNATAPPATCPAGSHTVFVYWRSGQARKEDCSTIYFRKDYWKERTGAWHVWDRGTFLNELKKTMEKQNKTKKYFWEKCLDFILNENLFQLFDDLGWGKENNISALLRSFYSKRGGKISLGFLTLLSPLGTRLSCISFSLLMDVGSIISPILFPFLFNSFWMQREWGTTEELLIDMCHPHCFFFRFQFNNPIHPSSVVYFLCIFYCFVPRNIIFYGWKLLMKKLYEWSICSRRIELFLD